MLESWIRWRNVGQLESLLRLRPRLELKYVSPRAPAKCAGFPRWAGWRLALERFLPMRDTTTWHAQSQKPLFYHIATGIPKFWLIFKNIKLDLYILSNLWWVEWHVWFTTFIRVTMRKISSFFYLWKFQILKKKNCIISSLFKLSCIFKSSLYISGCWLKCLDLPTR